MGALSVCAPSREGGRQWGAGCVGSGRSFLPVAPVLAWPGLDELVQQLLRDGAPRAVVLGHPEQRHLPPVLQHL